MKNTLENKVKFFANYWGKELLWANKGQINPFEICTSYIYQNIAVSYLELTLLSQISDKDLLKISRMMFPNSDIRNVGANEFSFWYDVRGANKGRWFHKSDYWGNLNTQQSDYLRSQSYALSWMGIKVDTLIEWGWIKLKTK